MGIKRVVDEILCRVSPEYHQSRQLSAFIEEVFIRQEYYFLVEALRPDTTVIDIGAAFGETSIYFAQFKDVKKVYGYEPNTIAFRHMLEYVKVLPFSEKISPSQVAIMDKDSSIKVGKEVIVLQEIKSSKKGVEIPVCSLATILIDKKNVVIKCDCEGEEYKIFKELSKEVLKECYKIQIEFHRGVRDLQEVLSVCGFETKIEFKSDSNFGVNSLGYIYGWRA
jgi:FkbM family methyltransferase